MNASSRMMKNLVDPWNGRPHVYEAHAKDKQALEYAISTGRGGLYLHLTET